MNQNVGWASTKQPIYSGSCWLVQRFPNTRTLTVARLAVQYVVVTLFSAPRFLPPPCETPPRIGEDVGRVARVVAQLAPKEFTTVRMGHTSPLFLGLSPTQAVSQTRRMDRASVKRAIATQMPSAPQWTLLAVFVRPGLDGAPIRTYRRRKVPVGYSRMEG